MVLRALVVGVMSWGAVASSFAADWPAFRGPERDGILRGQTVPRTWSDTENVVWRTELPGQGWSSPVVAEGKIFVTAAIEQAAVAGDGGDEKPAYDLAVLIVNAASGELLSQVNVFTQAKDAPRIHKKNSHASPTAVIDGDRLFVHFGHQGTACLSLDGEIVWRNEALAYSPVHGNGGSPAIVDDLVIFSRDGASTAVVSALNKLTGQLVWETSRDVEVSRQFSFCTPLVAELGGRVQLIIPGSNVVQSLNPSDGEEIWRVRYDGYSVIPRPVVDSGLVFVATGYNRPSLLAIDPTGSGDVTDTHLKWTEKTGIPHTPSLVALGGSVAMVSDKGVASCLDSVSGKLLWKLRIGGNFSASPMLVGDKLYFQSETGDCSIVDLSVEKPEIIQKNVLGERTLASYAVVDNTLVLRSEKALYRIGQ